MWAPVRCDSPGDVILRCMTTSLTARADNSRSTAVDEIRRTVIVESIETIPCNDVISGIAPTTRRSAEIPARTLASHASWWLAVSDVHGGFQRRSVAFEVEMRLLSCRRTGNRKYGRRSVGRLVEVGRWIITRNDHLDWPAMMTVRVCNAARRVGVRPRDGRTVIV